MKTVKHTPLKLFTEGRTISLKTVDGTLLAVLDIRQADIAAFIVTACNSHAELLEACKLTIKPLLALAKFIDTEGQKIPFEVRDASQAVLKAIAKAEKGE